MMAKQAKRKPSKRASKKSAGSTARKGGAASKGSAAKPASAFHMPDWVSHAWDAPLVREAVAAALIAGAGAAAAVFAHRQGLSGRKIKSAVSDAFDATKGVADAAVDAFADAASDTMKGFFPGDSRPPRVAASAPRREKGRDPTANSANVPPRVRDESL